MEGRLSNNGALALWWQAYQMLRTKREEGRIQDQRDAAVLTMEFTEPSGGVVILRADGRKVSQQTALAIRKELTEVEVNINSKVRCELVTGLGDEQRAFSCNYIWTSSISISIPPS